MPTDYSKTFLTVPDQIRLLRSRGMEIDNDFEAMTILRNVGYYRLSGYSYLFRTPDPQGVWPGQPQNQSQDEAHAAPPTERRLSTFVPGTSLTKVQKIYEFDRGLRIRLFDAIEMFEVALRFRVGHLLGQSHPFAHRDPEALHSEFTGFGTTNHNLKYSNWLDSNHADWLREVDREEARSQEGFVQHFKTKYGGPLPTWAVTEILSFGTLASLYSGMARADKERIAAAFDVHNSVPAGDFATLANWLNHIRYIRNTCAHHARLWNKNITTTLAVPSGIPELMHLDEEGTRTRIYGTLAVLAYLLARTHPETTWRNDVIDYINEGLASTGQSHEAMGFPAGWAHFEIWQHDYAPHDMETLDRKELLYSFETNPASGMGLLLGADLKPSRRADRVRYFRKKRLLLGLPLYTAYEYPTFQVDRDTNSVARPVAEANRRSYLVAEAAGQDEVAAAWSTARWWVTPHPLLKQQSPLEAHERGKLTMEMLDIILPAPDKPSQPSFPGL